MDNPDVFSKLWFLKHQRNLLWLANTSYGRDVLGISKGKSSVGDRKILFILPNSITWLADFQDNKPIYQTEFRTHDKFSKRLFYEFNLLWKLIHKWDMEVANIYFPKLNLGFDTLGPLYPAAGANSPVDGFAARSGSFGAVDETLPTIIAGAGNTSTATAQQGSLFLQANSTSTHYQYLNRGIFLFDTSALTLAANISVSTPPVFSLAGATADLGATKLNNLGSPTMHLVASTPASNAAIANSDYANLGSTTFGNITYASWSASNLAYNAITLNSSGIAAISKNSISKFGTRLDFDLNATGPTWSSNAISGFGNFFADEAGTTYDPKLVVTYSLGGGNFFPFL